MAAKDDLEKVVRACLEVLEHKYGSVWVHIHDGKVEYIDKTLKIKP